MIDFTTDTELNQLIIPNSGIEFTGDTFRTLCKPQVYVLIKQDKALYIGATGCGMARIAGKKHLQAEIARLECDRVLIYACETMDAALRLESILIEGMTPKYNKRKVLSRLARALGIQVQRAQVYNQ